MDRETGEAFDTYAVMTTPANVLMSEIHNNKKRMPFIVPEEHWGRWMDGSAADEQITDILKPLPDGVLTCHEISRNISKRGYDTNVPEIQAPVSAGTLF